jgi:hypothetical protein
VANPDANTRDYAGRRRLNLTLKKQPNFRHANTERYVPQKAPAVLDRH